ncbi:MAG: hypothetical protein SangKO_044350 [Sandaracinaceae bacterium]
MAVLLADDVLADDGATGAGRWTGFVSQTNQLSFRRHLEEAGLSPAEDLLRVLPESKAEPNAPEPAAGSRSPGSRSWGSDGSGYARPRPLSSSRRGVPA